jgi:nifR3 family TIM-barrel protein
MWKIRDIEFDNQIVIAPMAGVSNPAFRSIVAQYKPALIYSEMISDKAIVYKNIKTIEMTQVFEDEHPIALQLFGEDIDSMVKAAIYLDTETNCDIIDINMGCPVPKIVKGSGGASLMKTSELAFKIVEEVVRNVKKPVTVKIRLGWDDKTKNVLEMAKGLEKAGASAIAIHGRTRAQMYSGDASFELIKQVKENANIPIIANGDITSVDKAKWVLEYTKCDAVMIGRGILGQPWLVHELIEGLKGNNTEGLSLIDRFDCARKHALKLIDLKGEDIALKEMRSHLSWYLKGLPNSHKVKDVISQMKSFHEFDRILKDYYDSIVSESTR